MNRLKAARSERGAIMMAVAGALVVVCGFAALVIDLGDARQVSLESQTASDMASLAAAFDLSSDPADLAARTAAHQSAAEFAAGNLSTTLSPVTCRTGALNRLCYSDGEAYVEVTSPYSGVVGVPAHQQVRVEVCAASRAYFRRILTDGQGEVCRSATAVLDEIQPMVPTVLALDPSGSEAFHLEGVASVVGIGGPLASNSTSSSAFHAKDATTVTAIGSASCICAVGGASINGSASVSETPTTGSPAIADPWAELEEPSVSGAGYYSESSRTFYPGRYGSIKLDKPGTYTFVPGIYEFNGEFKIEGAGVRIVAEEVLWYFGVGGSANWGSGTNYIRISAQPDTAYYGGASGMPPVAILQARNNNKDFHIGDDIRIGHVSGGTCTVDSTAGISGGMYLPNTDLMVRGNTRSGLCTDGAPIVAFRVQLQETAFVQAEVDSSTVEPTRTTFLAQ